MNKDLIEATELLRRVKEFVGGYETLAAIAGRGNGKTGRAIELIKLMMDIDSFLERGRDNGR